MIRLNQVRPHCQLRGYDSHSNGICLTATVKFASLLFMYRIMLVMYLADIRSRWRAGSQYSEVRGAGLLVWCRCSLPAAPNIMCRLSNYQTVGCLASTVSTPPILCSLSNSVSKFQQFLFTSPSLQTGHTDPVFIVFRMFPSSPASGSDSSSPVF